MRFIVDGFIGLGAWTQKKISDHMQEQRQVGLVCTIKLWYQYFNCLYEAPPNWK